MLTLYVPRFDITPLTQDERRQLAVGQWVTVGPNGPRAQYLGQGQKKTFLVRLDRAGRRNRPYVQERAAERQFAREVCQ